MFSARMDGRMLDETPFALGGAATVTRHFSPQPTNNLPAPDCVLSNQPQRREDCCMLHGDLGLPKIPGQGLSDFGNLDSSFVNHRSFKVSVVDDTG